MRILLPMALAVALAGCSADAPTPAADSTAPPSPAVIQPTQYALGTVQLQPEYYRCWQGLKKHFQPADH